mmetsp:Transcript_15612/g.31837  ORF Transcript_15612/g.31837 Transcript_15612/m.31837 type:complete len:204 (-) Transcript_15612:446-1057(-)
MTLWARSANLSVLIVSSRQSEAGESVAMSTVLEFPPRLSCSKRVSLLSLYGTWPMMASGSFSMAFAFLLSAAMHRPSVYRLRLMLVSSSICSFSNFLSFLVSHFSLPAKSTRLNLDLRTLSPSAPSSIRVCSTTIWNRLWLRDDAVFMCVSLIALFSSPSLTRARQSPALRTAYSERPETYMPTPGSSWISRLEDLRGSRSMS